MTMSPRDRVLNNELVTNKVNKVKFNSIYDRWDISNVKTSLGTANFEDEFSYLASDVPQVHLHGLWTIACYTRQSNSMCIRINLTH